MAETEYTRVFFFLIWVSDDISVLLIFEVHFKDVGSGVSSDEIQFCVSCPFPQV